jgi:hypothetical protein
MALHADRLSAPSASARAASAWAGQRHKAATPVEGWHQSPRSVAQRERIGRWAASALPAASALAAAGVVQRAGGKDQMWDDYFTAYGALMARARNQPVDHDWRVAFFLLEQRLYAAKAANDDAQYLGQGVQDAHTALVTRGLLPQAPPPDQNVQVARALLVEANVRWQAFRGNTGLNRGAWAGSALHGARPANYVQTAPAVLTALTGLVQLPWWKMQSDSAPSGWALHRGGVDDRGDFIFHL